MGRDVSLGVTRRCQGEILKLSITSCSFLISIDAIPKRVSSLCHSPPSRLLHGCHDPYIALGAVGLVREIDRVRQSCELMCICLSLATRCRDRADARLRQKGNSVRLGFISGTHHNSPLSASTSPSPPLPTQAHFHFPSLPFARRIRYVPPRVQYLDLGRHQGEGVHAMLRLRQYPRLCLRSAGGRGRSASP
jgi:hypothetical protein